jgi:hypothetical protein
MTKTILITGTIGMIVGFGGTLLSLFGGGTLLMEYLLEFVVMLVLFLVMLIGAYWFVMVNPREEANKLTTEKNLGTQFVISGEREGRPYGEAWIEE